MAQPRPTVRRITAQANPGRFPIYAGCCIKLLLIPIDSIPAIDVLFDNGRVDDYRVLLLSSPSNINQPMENGSSLDCICRRRQTRYRKSHDVHDGSCLAKFPYINLVARPVIKTA